MEVASSILRDSGVVLATKLRSLSFAAHRRLLRRRSPPPPMTKKKKPKGRSANGSPSVSASSESSRSQSSVPTSSDLAVEVTSDPTDLDLPDVSSLAKTKSQSVVENGAVTATNFDGDFENPSFDHDGAVTATNVDGDLESPVSELLGAVTVTNVDGALATLVSETSGAVTATSVDGTIETPASEPSGAVTATLEEGEFVPPVSVTPATLQTVPVDKTQVSEMEQPRILHKECTRLRNGLRKDKVPIASELPIVDLPPPSQVNPVRTRASTEHAQPHRSGGKPNSSKSNSGHSVKQQSSNGSALPSAQKSLIFVDLNATGLSSTRNSTQGTDTDLDSGNFGLWLEYQKG
ncbi:hypothetical protein DY000_02012359 [Brassica cretica]|uniref:Uncharacterized protein n=1 Tax=Brassica cretica TaxID=69181 RepID=A0ABQ7CQQ4_BRACR|nr:hypothetical protein DY000_02012359 [Brassica cretica]